MSPSKKTTKKSAGKKKAGAKAKAPKKSAKKSTAKPAKKKAAARKKKSAAKPSARKAATKARAKPSRKKAATKTGAKKTATKTTAKRAAKKTAAPAKKSTAKQAPQPKAAAAKSKQEADAKAQAPAGARTKSATRKARPKKPVTPTGPRHPKLGFRWICFNCDAKFYDLGKDQPICPKCEVDQRDRPALDSKPTLEARKPKVVRPMAQLLDEEDPGAHAADDLEHRKAQAAQAEEMFDDAATTDSGLDLEEPEPDATAAPLEVDEF